ncbi:MAG: UDP-N-acetylglucosamine 2-epimerase [Candidatus Omnitrophota bacterium]
MKKMCIVTGTRAEWGLFYPLAKRIKEDSELELQIIATGTHLSEKFGYTLNEIKNDGFKVDLEVKTLIPNDIEESTGESIDLGTRALMGSLRKINPDLVFLLGDRFETFSAALACFLLKIPIAHIHGGELTEGALDDAFRHSITKMAVLHFTSTNVYRKRVIQMGEDPSRVFNVGALGLAGIKNTKVLDKEELEKELGLKFGKKNFLVTFHPVTLDKSEVSTNEMKNLLKVVDRYEDAKLIFTAPNCDMYSSGVKQMIDAYVSENNEKAVCFDSLGRKKYFSVLQFVDLVAGNSSSGIIEVPSFGIPTVNVGDRQKGRIRAISVIDAEGSFESIKNAFHKALSEEFVKSCREVKNPYGDSNAAEKIVEIIKRMNNLTVQKKFYDIEF